MKQATQKKIKEAENAFFRKIVGYEYQESKVTEEIENGEVKKIKRETYTKTIPPNEQMLLTWLRENAPEAWAQDHPAVQTTCGVVLLPAVEEGESD